MKIIGSKAGFIKRWKEKIKELEKLRDQSINSKDSERTLELSARIYQLNNCINDMETWEEPRN